MMHDGLPRRDIPLNFLRYTAGSLGRAPQRSVVGTTNRREHFHNTIAPALQTVSATASTTGGGPRSSSRLASTLAATVERSKSALDYTSLSGGRDFDLSSVIPPAFNNNQNNHSHATSHSHPCNELLDTLHYRPQQSTTPESLYFGSRVVGGAGQLQNDRIPPHLRSSNRGSSNHSRASCSPTPFPDHAAHLQHLSHADVLQRPGQPHVGSAGLMAPPAAEDTSVRSLAWTATNVGSVVQHRNLKETPHNGFVFAANTPAPTSTSRQASTPNPSSHTTSTMLLNQYTPQQRHYFVSTAGRDTPNGVSTLPTLPEAPRPKLRMELTDYHPTSSVVQAPRDAGAYTSEGQRFAQHTRGLGSSIAPQIEQAKACLLQVTKANRRRILEDAVHQTCIERDASLTNKKEAQIQHKHAAAAAAYRIHRSQQNEMLRAQEEMDARSAASVNRQRKAACTKAWTIG